MSPVLVVSWKPANLGLGVLIKDNVESNHKHARDQYGNGTMKMRRSWIYIHQLNLAPHS